MDLNTVSADEFERLVRSVSKQVFRSISATGPIKLDGRERDEILDTGTEIVIIEATKDRKKAKAEHDIKKSQELVRSLRKIPQLNDRNFRIVLVTAFEPTADQIAAVKDRETRCPKEIISFKALFSKLFDSNGYLQRRSSHSFGSIRNPADETDFDVARNEYVPNDLIEFQSGRRMAASDLAARAESGDRMILFGHFGSGKSMTLRDVYLQCADRHLRQDSLACPVYLNLREHIAQTDPAEALYRHSAKIGFPDSASLIGAWRAGFIHIFLDGFDELTPPQFTTPIRNLDQARRHAVELIYRFVAESPSNCALYVAGRENYFDKRESALSAMNLQRNAVAVDIAPFSDDQISAYLKKKKIDIPQWFPSRPLLLGYIANSGLLTTDNDWKSLDQVDGWIALLAAVCRREVDQIWGASADADELQKFIEGLANRSRRSADGMIVRQSDMNAVFSRIFGREPDESSHLLAGRLPGLAARPDDPGTREFVDEDLVQVAASAAVGDYLKHPHGDDSELKDLKQPLTALGLATTAKLSEQFESVYSFALEQSAKSTELNTVSSDIVSVMLQSEIPYTGSDLTVQDATFEHVSFDSDLDFGSLTFQNCIFINLEFSRSTSEQECKNLPKFRGCEIQNIMGVTSFADIDPTILDTSSNIETFVGFADTNNAIVDKLGSRPVAVLLTVIRKLFLQSGNGRQLRALKRGIPQSAVPFVEPIVAQMESEKFVQRARMDRREVIVPFRAKTSDALAILQAPNHSKSSLVTFAEGLKQ